jgi:ribosomal protein S18 acetylase RimI-like enzyme
MQICHASAPAEIELVRGLFEEYAGWLGIDLCFQGFADELAGLPGLYAPSKGRLFLGLAEGRAVGCAGVRPLDPAICEMKRLYVRPAFRGRGLGRRLARMAVQEARVIGYSAMRLDTLPVMQNAIRLYEELGFVRCAAYYDTPLADTIFMELRL